jgi:hypothetical protein
LYILSVKDEKKKAWHVACMEIMENVNKSLVGGRKGRGNLGDFVVNGSLKITIFLKDINCEDVGFVELGQDMDHWQLL